MAMKKKPRCFGRHNKAFHICPAAVGAILLNAARLADFLRATGA